MSELLLRKVDGLYSGRVSPLGAAAVLAGAVGAVGLLAAGAGLACAVWVTVVAGVAAGAAPGAAQAVKPTAATATAAAAAIRDFAPGRCMLLNISCLPSAIWPVPGAGIGEVTVRPGWPRSYPGIYQ